VQQNGGLRLGELEIIPKSRRVVMGGREISLTPKEFDILYFLAQNRGEVFTKEQIYRAVWSDNYLLDDSNIMAFIRKLRKKIEPNPDEPVYILTIWGIGYKFNDKI
jgi:DNA-binding response OmpR family regulator